MFMKYVEYLHHDVWYQYKCIMYDYNWLCIWLTKIRSCIKVFVMVLCLFVALSLSLDTNHSRAGRSITKHPVFCRRKRWDVHDRWENYANPTLGMEGKDRIICKKLVGFEQNDLKWSFKVAKPLHKMTRNFGVFPLTPWSWCWNLQPFNMKCFGWKGGWINNFSTLRFIPSTSTNFKGQNTSVKIQLGVVLFLLCGLVVFCMFLFGPLLHHPHIPVSPALSHSCNRPIDLWVTNRGGRGYS